MNPEVLVREICSAAKKIDPAVPLTADGGGPVAVTAYRRHESPATRDADLLRPCGAYPEGDGWMVTVADAGSRMPDSHHMFLPDRHLSEDRQGEIGATAVAVASYARRAAAMSGWDA